MLASVFTISVLSPTSFEFLQCFFERLQRIGWFSLCLISECKSEVTAGGLEMVLETQKECFGFAVVIDREFVFALKVINTADIELRRCDTFFVVDLFGDFFGKLIDVQRLRVLRAGEAQVAECNQFSA